MPHPFPNLRSANKVTPPPNPAVANGFLRLRVCRQSLSTIKMPPWSRRQDRRSSFPFGSDVHTYIVRIKILMYTHVMLEIFLFSSSVQLTNHRAPILSQGSTLSDRSHELYEAHSGLRALSTCTTHIRQYEQHLPANAQMY